MIRVRTGYSFRNASGYIDQVLDRLEEIGAPKMCISDRASTFGFRRWSDACKARGKSSAFGVEIAVSPDIHQKKPDFDHWTFIAKDDIAPINKALSLATEQFRYQPLLTYEQALSVDAIRITGHRPDLDLIKGAPEGTYAGVGPALSASPGYAKRLLRILPGIAVSDNRYPTSADKAVYEIITGRNAEAQTYPQHILTKAEWIKATSRLKIDNPEGLWDRSQDILEQTSANLKIAELVQPERLMSLEMMCEEGASALGVDTSVPVYKERLQRELRLIAEKQYEDYFYLVADICQFARKRMIVGPARGSSCGSLVCYLLGITTVDPIPHGLIFERFIDVNRDDLPDIDIDFSDRHRGIVFDYITNKYGAEHVARLGSVAMYKARSALQETAAALRVPRWKADPVAESLLERSSGDSRALSSLEDTLKQTPAGQKLLGEYPEMEICGRLEGHPRHYSQHAAGVVVSRHPIQDYVGIDHRTGATQCDKVDAEELGLLKIDALGLTQLSVFEECLELINLPFDHLESIPLDDPAAFDVLNSKSFCGIFQFNGLAIQSIATQITMDKFDDIVSITALGRPGPLASGGANEWVKRRNGAAPVSYVHECFRKHLEATMGIVVYQEQVMEIGRQIGDLDWGQVTALRKAMSKSLGKEFFDQFGDPWKKGAIAKGVDPDKVDKVWDDLCAYGAWSFNKSHSVAYGIISYWCCWLKAHYPAEFAAATLTRESDPDRQLAMLREMTAEGISYVPIDPNLSTDKWTVRSGPEGKILVGPLSNVKGIGPRIINSILGARARNEPLPDRAAKLLSNPTTTLDSLWPIADAFKRVMPEPRERNINTPPTAVEDVENVEHFKDVVLFVTLAKINPRDENEPVLVARRGFEITDGKTAHLNLQMQDDTGIIFGKINRFRYEKIGAEIVNRGSPGKHLYAIKGQALTDGSFKMISIQGVKYIGSTAQ